MIYKDRDLDDNLDLNDLLVYVFFTWAAMISYKIAIGLNNIFGIDNVFFFFFNFLNVLKYI